MSEKKSSGGWKMVYFWWQHLNSAFSVICHVCCRVHWSADGCLGLLATTVLVQPQKLEVPLMILRLFTFECPACARLAPFHLSFGVFQCLSTRQTPWKLFLFENASFIHQRNLAKDTCIFEGTVFSHTQIMTWDPDFLLIWLHILCAAAHPD